MMDNLTQLKIPMENVINLDEYNEYKNLIQCYLCKNLSITPYNCENCRYSFCKQCIDELKISNLKCPNCMIDGVELYSSTQKFSEFFKDLIINCPKCRENVYYVSIHDHKCFNSVDSKLTDNEEYTLIGSTIMVKCKKCGEFVENASKLAHYQICQGKSIEQSNPTLFKSEGTSCKFCLKTIALQSIIDHLLECQEFLKKVNSNKVQELAIKPLGVNLVELSQNLNKFSSNITNTNIDTLANEVKRLNDTLNSQSAASYCRKCNKVYIRNHLTTCKCCNKFYCTSCCVPCLQCEEIISNRCLVTCKSCNMLKCPLCEIQLGCYCLCIEVRFCKICYNTPNTLGVNQLSSPHVTCNYLRQLENGVFIFKFPKFSFKCDLNLNSVRQYISLHLIVKGKECLSKLFSINANDRIIIQKDTNLLAIGSTEDYWEVDMKLNLFDLDFEYLILNFKENPNHAQILNNFNLRGFDTLSPSNIPMSGLLFRTVKPLFSNILVQKI